MSQKSREKKDDIAMSQYHKHMLFYFYLKLYIELATKEKYKWFHAYVHACEFKVATRFVALRPSGVKVVKLIMRWINDYNI